jgi:prefoldin subunit 5
MEELMKQMMSELKEFKSDVNEKFARLELGHEKLKESFQHNAIVMTESFTAIRKDIREKNHSIEADINLLFKEVESLKRQINKIEQRLSN